MKKLVILMMILWSVGINSAIAAPQPQGVSASSPDEEEKFDDALQQFGYLSGAVFQCAKLNNAPSLEGEILRVFSGIIRLFGSDRAFFYAAAYGAGATASIDRNKCADYTQQFQQAIQKSPLNR
ncbi:MAG: hypothetical protein ACKO24_07550 [Leptolyngbyaceae cyanobacterium]